MAKSSGLGDAFFLDGYDLSGDANAFEISSPLAVDEVPGIDVLAQQRIGLGRDSSINWTAYWNVAAGHAHPVLSARPTADRVASYFHTAIVGGPAASHVCKQINYDPNRAESGALRAAVATQGNGYGVEWGVSLTAQSDTFASAASGTAVDLAASTDLGLQAYLHALSIGSGTATVAVQDSADGSTSWADVVAFTDVTAAGSQRVATAATENVKRYIRVNVTGTFTDLVIAVMARKNTTAVTF